VSTTTSTTSTPTTSQPSLLPTSPLRAAIDGWLHTCEVRVHRRTLRQATFSKYRRNIQRAAPLFDLPINAIEPADILTWYDDLVIPRRDGTAARIAPLEALRAVRNCLSWARARRLCPHNAATGLHRTIDAEPGRPLDFVQVARLLRGLGQLEAERDAYAKSQHQSRDQRMCTASATLVLHILLLTGARLGEIAACRRDHIDEAVTRITWPRGKNNRKRVILLPPFAQTLIREQLARTAPLGNPYLFPSPAYPHHRPITSNGVWSVLRRATTIAKLPGVRPNDLRHTVATRLQAMGVSLDEIMGVLGHDRRESLRPYLHGAEAPAVRRAIEAFEHHVHGGPG